MSIAKNDKIIGEMYKGDTPIYLFGTPPTTTKISVKDTGIKFGNSTFEILPEYYDFDGVEDFSYMFYYCTKLKTMPQINTSSAKDMSNMFSNCFLYLTSIPLIDTRNVTTMKNMFYGCQNLKTIPLLDTSNVENIEGMLAECLDLVQVPPLNAEKVTSKQMFGISTITALTDFGGLIGLKVDFNGIYAFNKCPNLTYQSCINILNGLHDFRSNGDTTTTRTLKVHQNFLTLVGDEVSIGTNKGWNITA